MNIDELGLSVDYFTVIPIILHLGLGFDVFTPLYALIFPNFPGSFLETPTLYTQVIYKSWT